MRTHSQSMNIEALEPRLVLSADPQVFSLAIMDPNSISAGHQVTLVVHATDDVGVQAVTFFVDVNADNEWTPGIDRHLGDRFSPDNGTADQYTFTFIADWDTPGAGVRIRFAANAVDTDGQWPVNAFTTETDIYQRLSVTELLAEPISSTQVRLTASVSAPFGVATAGMRGVTFWYDANGNNAWDPGIDTDLGYTESAHGNYQAEYTITPTINALWAQPLHFAAAARDLRESPDRFGTPHSGILRQTGATAPQVASVTVLPVLWPTQHDIIAGQSVDLTMWWNSTGAMAATIFRDVNLNGVWDYSIDQSLGSYFYSTQPTSQAATIAIDKSWGSGLMAIGVAIRSDPGLGDDAWSPVKSVYFVTNFAAWVKQPAQSTLTAAVNQPVSIDVTARDDYAVKTLSAFIDINQDNVYGPGDVLLTNITATSTIGRSQVNYRIALNAPSSVGSYHIGFYASDYGLPSGPVTFVTLVVS